MTATTATTYAEYLAAIFGDRHPWEVIVEFELEDITRVQLDEWVGHNEDVAEQQGLTLDDQHSARLRADLWDAKEAA